MTVLDELTEIEDLEVSKVSAVDAPATGSPGLFIKSRGPARVSAGADDDQKKCELCGGSGAILAGHRKCPTCHGSGTVAKSSSAEADAFQLQTTDEDPNAQDAITTQIGRAAC